MYGDYGQEAVRISGNGQCLVIESNAGGLGYSVYAVDGEVVAAGRQGPGRLVLRCLRASIWCEPRQDGQDTPLDFAQSTGGQSGFSGNSEESGLSACIEILLSGRTRVAQEACGRDGEGVELVCRLLKRTLERVIMSLKWL